MALDTALVLIVAIIAVALNPRTEAQLHRLDLTFRLWRNGYTVRAAWRLSEGR